MGKLDGKVAFITGAARGMGRSHAVRLAEEGADIIALDICGPVPSSTVPPATPEDLKETAALVEALDRRIITFQADTRDEEALRFAIRSGVQQLGRVDIVVANAGIGGIAAPVAEYQASVFRDVIDIDLTAVFLTAKVTIPHLRAHGDGGSIVLISSALGLRGIQNIVGYVAAKHGVVGIMKSLAVELAPERIRVNAIHPTHVDTPMVHHEEAYRLFRPDLEKPGREDAAEPLQALNLLPTPWIDPSDVSEAVLYLVSDSGRFVTGTSLTVDAGWTAKP
jgi:(+)-trans-carveol dehydrogenase/(-)-trans-carveol dehydrogenase